MSARSVGSCPGRRGAGTRREAMRAETTINMLKELQGRAARFHRVRCKRPKERVGYPRKPIIHSAPSCYRAGSTPPRLRSAAGRPAPVGVGCTASAHTSVSATAYVVGAATTAQSPTVPPRAQATVAACYRPRQHPVRDEGVCSAPGVPLSEDGELHTAHLQSRVEGGKDPLVLFPLT